MRLLRIRDEKVITRQLDMLTRYFLYSQSLRKLLRKV